MFARVKVDRLINSSVHRKIGLLITIQVQRRNVNATFNRVLPNRRPHGFATDRNLSRHSDIHRNQLHRTMTRRTEFTASIQSEVRFGKTHTLPRERNASTKPVGADYSLAQAIKHEDKNSAAPRNSRTAMSCRRHCHAAAHFILVRFYGFRPWRSVLGGASIVSSVECHLHLLKKLWLAVDEIVHHDNVMVPIVVPTRGKVPGLDPDRRDAGVMKHDAEEGQASVTRRRRNETAEDEFAVSVEVLDARACMLRANSNAIWLINICEHRAETSNCSRDSAIGTRYVEGRFGNVAPHRCEQTGETEGLEDFGVGGIAKQHGQSALGPAGRRSLRKPQPGCFKLAAAGVQEHEERIYRRRRIKDVGVATIPVDLPPTL